MTFELILIGSIVIALSFWLEDTFRWFLHISNTVLIIAFGALLANIGAISSTPDTYDPLFKWGVPLGIILMLFAFNPKHIFQMKPAFLQCFGVGALASMLGGLIAGLLFAPILPDDYWRVTGQLTATYIGGYENAIAVGTALAVPTPLFVQMFAADSILTAIWIMCSIYLGKTHPGSGNNQNEIHADKLLINELNITSLSIALAVSFCILFIVQTITAWLPGYANSTIILAGILATLTTFTPLKKYFSGTYILGSVLLAFFFFACGAISDIHSLMNQFSILILFPATIVFIHAVILFGFAKWRRISRDITSIASQALIGGPATALGVVMALKLPYRFEAICLGLLGYAVANYMGIATALMTKQFWLHYLH